MPDVAPAADEPDGVSTGHRHTSQWWRDVATLVGLAGLVVTMIFNTIAVFSSADQAAQAARDAKATRINSQVAVLTSLSSYLQRYDLQLARPEIEAARCNALAHPLDRRQRLRVQATLGGFDYLAWLVNQETWELDEARRYWAPQMVYALDVAKSTLKRTRVVRRRFAELDRFMNELSDVERLLPRC